MVPRALLLSSRDLFLPGLPSPDTGSRLRLLFSVNEVLTDSRYRLLRGRQEIRFRILSQFGFVLQFPGACVKSIVRGGFGDGDAFCALL